jgi:hypothetical protein
VTTRKYEQTFFHGWCHFRNRGGVAGQHCRRVVLEVAMRNFMLAAAIVAAVEMIAVIAICAGIIIGALV